MLTIIKLLDFSLKFEIPSQKLLKGFNNVLHSLATFFLRYLGTYRC